MEDIPFYSKNILNIQFNAFLLFLKTYVALRSLSTKHSPGQNIPSSSGESGGSSGA